MMEFSLSAFAWMGYIMFQAMLHYTLRCRKRLEDDEPALDASPLVLELARNETGGGVASRDIEARFEDDDDEERCAFLHDEDANECTLDGDEPPVFFELLSQTGCEMMRNVSIQSIVMEQMYEERDFLTSQESSDRHLSMNP